MIGNRQIYRGWVVVAAAFTVMLVGFACAYAYAAFFPSLEQEFAASRARVSSIFAVAGALYFGLGAFSGPLSDRFGPRGVCIFGMAALGAGLAYAGVATTLDQVFLGFSLGIGVGVGFSYVPAIGAVQPWFTSRRGFASGIAVSGIGVGTLVGPLAASALIAVGGWRIGFIALGAGGFVLGTAAALLLDNDPARHDASDPADALRPAAAQPSLRFGAAARTAPFWLLYLSWASLSFALFIPFVHMVPYALDHGLSAATGALVLGCIGVGSTAGRFLVGGVADRFGRLNVMGTSFLGLAVMLLLWLVTTEAWSLIAFALVFGTFYGGFVALAPAVAADFFGTRAAGAIIGVLYSGVGIGTLLGPPFAGYVYDRFGSYQAAIVIAALAAAVASALMIVLPSPHTWRAKRVRSAE